VDEQRSSGDEQQGYPANVNPAAPRGLQMFGHGTILSLSLAQHHAGITSSDETGENRREHERTSPWHS